MKGSCVCGNVAFAVDVAIEKLYQCHCKICQKQTGTSAVTGCFVATGNFRWISGEDSISSFTKPSGYRYDFCRCCGATVPNMFRSGDKVWIPVGAFDEPISAKVTDHIFVKYKAGWDEIGGDGVLHDEFYPVNE